MDISKLDIVEELKKRIKLKIKNKCKLSDKEEINVDTLISNINYKKYARYKYNDIIDVISLVLINKISNNKVDNTNDNIDVSGYMNNEIKSQGKDIITKYDTKQLEITSLLGLNSVYDIQLALNPTTRYEKTYLVFDSFDRLNPQSTDEFKFGYTETSDYVRGSVGAIGGIRNLISIKLYQPIFPVAIRNTVSDRISILIKELSTQSIIASSNFRYHWILRTNQSQWIGISTYRTYVEGQLDNYNDGVFNFRIPITEINSFTFIFGDPLSQISIPVCQDYCTFTYGSPTTVILDNPHTLVSSVVRGAVFFTDFTTDEPSNPVDMNAIMAFNNPVGLEITVLSPTIITIPIDTNYIHPKPNLKCIIYFSQYRFIFAMELTCINDGL